MKKSFIKKNSHSIPWFETIFANRILKNEKNISFDLKKKAKFFIDNGYLIIKNVIDDKFLSYLIKDFNRIIHSNEYKKNPKYFHYNSSPRIVEGWKQSKYIKKLCFQNEVISFLDFIIDLILLDFPFIAIAIIGLFKYFLFTELSLRIEFICK